MAEQSSAWHEGLPEPLKPDPNRRECCKTVLFGGLTSLSCVCDNDLWRAAFKLDVNFCPHCGRDMKKVRAEVIFELENDYGNPANWLKMHPGAFPEVKRDC